MIDDSLSIPRSALLDLVVCAKPYGYFRHEIIMDFIARWLVELPQQEMEEFADAYVSPPEQKAIGFTEVDRAEILADLRAFKAIYITKKRSL